MRTADEFSIQARPEKAFTATRNACKLCTPLGATIAFKGMEGCLPLLHGSQGCATYVRRYMISHYKEPVDVASSNFSEESTIFGGNKNFCTGIDNIRNQYSPKMIAIASTCLSETIGEDIPQLIKEYQAKNKGFELPIFIHASTPSYQGTHADGFHEAVSAAVKTLSINGAKEERINLFPGFVSPEDLRYLKEIATDFGLAYSMVPDYSDSLDNPTWDEYKRIPDGGTTISDIAKTGSAKASVQMGYILNKGSLAGKVKNRKKSTTAGEYLQAAFDTPLYETGLPIGIAESDKFFEILEKLSGNPIPDKHAKERGRLVDAYVDGHKHVFGKRAVVYGEEDLVIGLVSFLNEIGIEVVLAASGGASGKMRQAIQQVSNQETEMIVMDDGDFEEVKEKAKTLAPDIFVGHSKGYYITRELKIPLVRVGFPIHDRMGGQRVLHLGYRGTQQLFDKVANAIIEYKQEKSEVGYKYM